MNEEQQLKLQAYLDGELPARDARDVAAWVEGDPAAAALLDGLKAVREALDVAQPQVAVPETREFYWSKIARRIEVLERTESDVRPAWRWQNLLWPIGATAVCLAVVLLQNPFAGTKDPTLASIAPDADTPIVEAMQPDSEATTYRDESDGTTLVWFSMNDNHPAKPTATF